MLNLDSQTHRMRDEYDILFRQCVSLNTELHKLGPLARQMHLLSSNAVSSAARAGSEGDAFRVLTQDIQLLGDEVSACILDTQKVIGHIVMLASTLARLFASYVKYRDVLQRIESHEDKNDAENFFNAGLNKVTEEINHNNHELAANIRRLSNLLSPLSMLVKKGEYLAVYSSVEAASAGEHGTSFDAVARMLRELVRQLGQQSARQQSLLRDLAEGMEKLQFNQRETRYAS